MKKVVRLTENELSKLISRIINEGDFSVEPHIKTQPREKDVRGVFGKKYGPYIPIDVLRYIRKNPRLIFANLYDIYGEKAYEYLDMAKGDSDSQQEDNLDI